MSLRRLQYLIDLGRVDPTQPIDLTQLVNGRGVTIQPLKRDYGVQLVEEVTLDWILYVLLFGTIYILCHTLIMYTYHIYASLWTLPNCRDTIFFFSYRPLVKINIKLGIVGG